MVYSGRGGECQVGVGVGVGNSIFGYLYELFGYVGGGIVLSKHSISLGFDARQEVRLSFGFQEFGKYNGQGMVSQVYYLGSQVYLLNSD